MAIDPTKLKAVVFDYGNTLIEFAHDQIGYCDSALASVLANELGEFDEHRFNAIRHADRRAPYHNGYQERQMEEICAELVEQLYGRRASDEELAMLLEVRLAAFVDAIEAPVYVDGLLDRLGKRYKLAVLSNYPSGRAVRASLEKTGIDRHLHSVVVSGDVGHVKPHPKPFELVLSELAVEPGEALYIGDNWLADVQGAKRMGMSAAHTVQWDTPEKFDPEPDDYEPDIVLNHLTELEQYI